jgi:hypothetical protein
MSRSILALTTCAGVLLYPLIAGDYTAKVNSIPSERQRICYAHLRQIARALRDYHSIHGQYPPPCLRDSDGKPMHSWRALIMPYTDFGASLGEYDYTQPWNSRHNKSVTETKEFVRSSSLYACPNATLPPDRGFDVGRDYGLDLMTNYLMVTYGGTGFYDAYRSRNAPPRQAIVIVEVKNSGIHWAEPRDIGVETLKANAEKMSGVTVSSNDPDGPVILFSDWSMRRWGAKGSSPAAFGPAEMGVSR